MFKKKDLVLAFKEHPGVITKIYKPCLLINQPKYLVDCGDVKFTCVASDLCYQ